MENDLKTRILMDSILLFKEKSVHFTLDEVSANLKISKKTVYKYYSSKENILSEAVDMFFDELIIGHNEILAENCSALEKLEKVVALYPEFNGIEDYHVDEIEKTYPKVYQRIMERLHANWDLTFALIDECKAQGLIINVNNEYLRMILLSLFENVLAYKDQKKVLRECISYIFNGIIKKE